MNTFGSPVYIVRATEIKKRSETIRRRGTFPGRKSYLTVADPESPRLTGSRFMKAAEVRGLRDSLGLTQEVFAEVLNVHINSVKKYESSAPKSARIPSCYTRRLMGILSEQPHLTKILRGKPRYFTGAAIKMLRERTYRVSQNVFAPFFGATKDAVAAWEQNRRHPSGPMCRLLEIASDFPDLFMPDTPDIPTFPHEAQESEQAGNSDEATVTATSTAVQELDSSGDSELAAGMESSVQEPVKKKDSNPKSPKNPKSIGQTIDQGFLFEID